MFEGASAVQARVGSGHRQIQRCARTRKSMETPFLARSIIARLIISNSCLFILLLLLILLKFLSRGLLLVRLCRSAENFA